jgi:hypothetical protein
MKAKNVKCKDCGGSGELQGMDHTNTEGPFYVSCKDCGAETAAWYLPRLALRDWKMMNLTIQGDCRCQLTPDHRPE